jgi:sarcosine dehydrogenase
MLNDQGRHRSRPHRRPLAPDRFYIVTGTGFATRDRDWISRNIPSGMAVTLEEVTSAWAVLSLFGPHSRDILQPLTQADSRNARLPFRPCPGDPHRRLPRPGPPRHLCGRTGLGAAHPRRLRRQPLRCADGGRRAARPGTSPVTAPSKACAWRRPTAPGAATSAPTTRPSGRPRLGREAADGNSLQGPGPPSFEQQQIPLTRRLAGFTVADPSSASGAAKPSTATASAAAGSSSPAGATRSSRSIGLGYVRNPNGVDDAYILDRAATNSRSRASASPPRSSSTRPTTRRTSGSEDEARGYRRLCRPDDADPGCRVNQSSTSRSVHALPTPA